MANNDLKVVGLHIPALCQGCEFGQNAEARTRDGGLQRVIYCRRSSCVNWITSEAEEASELYLHGDEAA